MDVGMAKPRFGGANLRAKCFIIGYLHLISSIVDILCHLWIVAALTRGFECDITKDSLDSINWSWVIPLLFFVNFGTHGFYPFPMLLPFGIYTGFSASEPGCYPGMLHISLIDVVSFLINTIWLKFVIAYVCALHKKDPAPMSNFCALSAVKLTLQVLYFAFQPFSLSNVSIGTYWFIKIGDIGVAAGFLYYICQYMKQVKGEIAAKNFIDRPPSYIECLIKNYPTKDEKKDQEVILTVAEDIEPVVPETRNPL